MTSSQWLESFAHHSIFSNLARSSSIDNSTTFPLGSPDASTIHGGYSFATLAEAQGAAPSESSSGGKARQLAVVARKSELVVAVGREVRITSLAGYKARIDSGSANSSSSGSYKVCVSLLAASKRAKLMHSRTHGRRLTCQL